MNDSTKTLMKMKKAGKLVRLAQRKNGPKSYKRGQGALLRTLLENDGATQRELCTALGLNRGALKDVVRKAKRPFVASLARPHHGERHLEKPLAAPVRVASERTAVGVVRYEIPEKRRIVFRRSPCLGRRPVRKHPGEVVRDRERIAGRHSLFPARSVPDKTVHSFESGMRPLEMVRLEAL